MGTKGNKGKEDRILIYGQLPPPFHGSNVMTQCLFDALKEIGYPSKISEKDFSRTIFEVNRINIVKMIRYGRYLFRFLNDIIKFKPHLIVFLTSTSSLAVLAESVLMFIAKIFGIPYVLYLHTPGYYDICRKKAILGAIVRWNFRSSLGCLVLGRNLEKEISHIFRGKIFILPNCLTGSGEMKIRERTLPVKVLFLSNITEEKGILTCLESLVLIKEKHPDIRLVAAGPWQDEKTRERVMEFILSRGLSNHWDFRGPVYGDDKEELLSSCDIFAFPSRYSREAMSLVVLEAMRAGKPVITSTIGELPDVIIDGECGFIISQNDPAALAEKITRLIEAPALMDKMGQAARRRFLEMFSFQSYVKNLRHIMDEILC